MADYITTCSCQASQVCTVCDPENVGFTLEQRDEISRAFDAGNYANAYETTDLGETDVEDMAPHERVAFVLGFFGTYTLNEIGSDRDAFDEAYFSPAGRYVVEVAKYTDDRSEEYAEEQASDTAGATEEGRTNE